MNWSTLKHRTLRGKKEKFSRDNNLNCVFKGYDGGLTMFSKTSTRTSLLNQANIYTGKNFLTVKDAFLRFGSVRISLGITEL